MKKKVIYIATIVLLSLFLLASCRSTSRCPAYASGQAELVEATQNA